jgi:hypothetical protein
MVGKVRRASQTSVERLIARDYCVSGARDSRHPLHPGPSQNRTSGFPIHPAPRFIIQYASALRHGFRSLRILGLGQFTQIKAWLNPSQVYALRWLLRLSHLNTMRVAR